jgi:TDG/mug DNA glycosylase family protein
MPMDTAETIANVNRTIQGYMSTNGARVLKADQAAELVYAAGIMSPDEGPSGAPGITFREFLRDLRGEYGYDTLYSLLGVRQSDNQPNGKYTIFRFDAPSMERIKELLAVPHSEGSSPSESTGETESLPDYLQEGLDVVFVGITEGSSGLEHYHSDSSDRFWDLVNESGLVSEMVGAENDRFIVEDKCGLTHLAKSSSINPGNSEVDVEGFIRKIETYKPKMVAFNGKQAFKEVFKRDANDYGHAEEIVSESYVFVLPSSSGADSSMKFEEKLVWYKNLKATLRTI